MKKLYIITLTIFALNSATFAGVGGTHKNSTSNTDTLYEIRMEKAAKLGIFFEGVDKDQSWFEPSEEHLLMRTKLLNKEISIREYYLFREDARKMAMNYTWDENPLNIKLKDVIYLENISELVRNNFVNKKMHSEWLNYWNEDSIRIRNENIY
jgi:hypothetical protein